MKWLRYLVSLLLVGAFFASAWMLQPENPERVGKIVLLILGILTVAGIILSGIYLYSRYGRKISVPSFNGAGKFLGRLAGRDKIGTTLLVGLFFLTLSYAIGGREEWKDSLRWWWNSKIFLPSLFAVIGVILFVDPKWRKKIDRALIFTISAMILFSLLAATPSITNWWGGTGKSGDKVTKKTVSPSAPQNVSVEVQKTRKETILAEYGTFTEVPLPPAEKLLNVRWDVPNRYSGRCLAVVVHKARPDGEVFPCESPIRGLSRATRLGFSSDDPLEGIPIEVKITYLTTE